MGGFGRHYPSHSHPDPVVLTKDREAPVMPRRYGRAVAPTCALFLPRPNVDSCSRFAASEESREELHGLGRSKQPQIMQETSETIQM